MKIKSVTPPQPKPYFELQLSHEEALALENALSRRLNIPSLAALKGLLTAVLTDHTMGR